MSPTTARYGADFLQIGNCAFASKCDNDCSKYPPHEHHSSKRSLTGPDLHAWRIRMSMSAKELGKLIGVTERSVHAQTTTQTSRLAGSLFAPLLPCDGHHEFSGK